MEETISSKALEANLAETRVEEIDIPEDHQQFILLSQSHRGIHQRTREFMLEFHHPYSNRSLVVERWREIVLRDLWFYNSLEESESALILLIDIARTIYQSVSDDLRETVIRTLLEFTGNIAETDPLPAQAVHQALEVIHDCIATSENPVFRNTRYFKIHLTGLVKSDSFQYDIFNITKSALSKSICYWESTSKVEEWFDTKRELFNRNYEEVIAAIGRSYFVDLHRQLDQAQNWSDLESIPSFDDIAGHFHQTVELLDSPLEKIYFIVFMLKHPGMEYLKDTLLLDINRLLKNVHQELTSEEIISFSENLFTLFQDLNSDYAGTVMDCLMTLGKEVIDSGDQEIIDAFIDSLVQFGFITPGEIQVDHDWQVRANVNHLKNIRFWMRLIEHAPYRMQALLSALIVNLRLEGLFIADTDLFQRDITRLLNSDITPVYKQVKELAKLFPVYFNEIGAEGELREVTTQIDELSRRKDRLIHFLRKQTHTESNATHLELTRKIIRFWYDGNVDILKGLVPADVMDSVDLEGEWFIPVHGIVQELTERMKCTPERLLKVNPRILDKYLNFLSDYDESDKNRVRYLIRINSLLSDKYSFETRDTISALKRYRVFKEEEIDELGTLLAGDDAEAALKKVYDLMRVLKEVILNPIPSESSETIYHKRHVAAGIPSMYGRYSDPKLEALGLTFRLEQVASRLMEQIIDDINLTYITSRHLRRICSALALFKEGFELDGVYHERYNSNLRMLESSFASSSCSLGQYANMFEFLERNVKDIIEEYFLDLYDQPLKMITPQHIRNKYHLPEAGVRLVLNRRSEEFYTEILASTFLIQALDNFVSGTLNALRSTSDNFSPELIREVMTYDSELAISSLLEATPRLDNQIFLGAKAFFLKAMYAAGFPVPEGFVLTTEIFRHRQAITMHPQIQDEIQQLIWQHVTKLEKTCGCKFGKPGRPLLLSVRSGTAMSMPGAMSTLLNVGMNEEIAEAMSLQTNLGRAAWDCYRRLLQSWGMTCGIERDPFDRINAQFEDKYQIIRNTDFTREQMREVALAFKTVLAERNIMIADDPFEQLRQAITIVMDSWYSERAKVYRENLEIAEEWGTAVIVQKMVLGNIGEQSGTGVLLTHDPNDERPGINPYGDFRLCSQGEDVVTGWLQILPLTENQRKKYDYDMDISMESSFPQVYSELIDIASQLVYDYDLGPQEIEFTFESPQDLYILQARRQDIQKQDRRLVFAVPSEQMELVGRGIGIGGGALCGILAFDMKDLETFKEDFPSMHRILIRPDTVPDDIGLVFNCDGLLTGKGGATSHAAVTAARLGKVCVVGCKDLLVNEKEKTCSINGMNFKSGDKISLEGFLGNIYKGHYPTQYVDMT